MFFYSKTQLFAMLRYFLFFFWDSAICSRAIFIFLSSLGSQMPLNIFFVQNDFCSRTLAFLETHVLIILFCKSQQRYFDLNVKNKFLKNLSLYLSLKTLILVFFLRPNIVHIMIKWGLNRFSNDLSCVSLTINLWSWLKLE